MPSNLKAEDIIWDDNDIAWDEPVSQQQPQEASLIAQILGSPVEIRNKVLNYFGIPTDNPIGQAFGEQHFNQMLDFSPEANARRRANYASSSGSVLMNELEQRTDAMLSGRKPQPLNDEALKAAVEFGIGFNPVTTLAGDPSKFYNPMLKQPSAKALENAQAFERAGVKSATGAIIKEGPISTLGESTAGKTITGRMATSKSQTSMQNELEAFADKISPTRATGDMALKGGEKATTEYAKRLGVWTKIRNKAYERVFKHFPHDTPISRQNVLDEADSILSEISDTATGVLGDIRRVAKNIKSYKQQQQSLRGMIQDQRLMGEKAYTNLRSDPTSSMYYNRLEQAFKRDLDTLADSVGGKFSEEYVKAVKIAREGDGVLPGMDVFRNSRIQSLLETKDAAKIAESAFTPHNTKELTMLRKAVGFKGWKGLQDAWAENMMRKSIPGGQGTGISPIQFEGIYRKFDKKTIDMITQGNPILRRNLEDMATIGRAFRNYQKWGGNPSGSGQIVGGLAQMGAVGMMMNEDVDPRYIVLTLATPYLLGRMTTSNTFLRMAKEGLKYPPHSNAAVQIANKMAAIAGIEWQGINTIPKENDPGYLLGKKLLGDQ